ncbi:MAG: DUF1772 domain-containing protein [Alphaproteobacteria bacterium]|jgi:uncharacterized membrane protein|nr:DUF1772 domain-containing protein [Alphaproteobacteria bacterium]
MTSLLIGLALAGLMLTGGIFGFFYAWVCSTMWGLDAAPPNVAIAAMQAMNASVRNGVFAPAFFGTPIVLAATAILAIRAGCRASALSFGTGAIVYSVGALLVTMTVNVPMNEALASATIPADPIEVRALWQQYSTSWQFWNQLRTIMSGVALLLAGIGLLALRPAVPSRHA